jgi:2-methylcitrate dehydratase PrpD
MPRNVKEGRSISDNQTLEDRIVAHLSDTQFDDLPSEAIEGARRCILDTLGVIAAGSGGDDINSLMELLQQWSSRPQATVLVHGVPLSALHATWVNGAMARAREFDDSHDGSGDHISVPIMPSALAAVELTGEVSGRDLLLAYALAGDLNARLRLAPARGTGDTSFAANTCAPFSAAVVAARILGLKGDGMYHALGWAYAQCAGSLQLQQGGASALHIHHGLAASTGLQAALLARQGLPGPKDFLTGKFGFYNAYERGEFDPSKVTEGLGEVFEIGRISVKQYPCGRVTHGPIEAAISLHNEESIAAADIEEVIVTYGRLGFRMTGEQAERRNPSTVQHAKFSVYYTVACALARGHVDLEDFTADALADPIVREIVTKTRVEVNPEFVGIFPGIVTLKMKDGRQLRREVPVLKGTPDNPLTFAEIADKFRSCVAFAAKPISERKVEAAIDFIANLESAKNVRELVSLLT